MDLTSPEHDALIARAVAAERSRAFATGLADHHRIDQHVSAIRADLFATDQLRYTVEATDAAAYLTDRWDGGRVIDWHVDGHTLHQSAARRNVGNAHAGRGHLADQLAAAADPIAAVA